MDNKWIPVLALPDATPEFLKISDICYTSLKRGKIIFHTLGKDYQLISNIEELYSLLYTFEFRKTDRGTLVHIANMVHFDESYRKIYFDRMITKHSKYATVSSNNISNVVKFMRERDRQPAPDHPLPVNKLP